MNCLRHKTLGHPLGRSCRHVWEGLPSGCMVCPDKSLPATMQGHRAAGSVAAGTACLEQVNRTIQPTHRVLPIHELASFDLVQALHTHDGLWPPNRV